MSSGAVAASDPGGGEPKPVAAADVAMMEAAEEVDATAAEVGVEGKARVVGEGDAATAMDVEQEGGEAAAVSDPLYATESAGMVTEEGRGDEPVEGAEGVNGADGGQEMVQAGAGGLQSEAETKPVPAGYGAGPAVAGQAVESAVSAASEHAEARSNKLEENYVNADPGRENKECDNGVAHCYKEIQNNVPVGAEGSSKINEDDGAPAVDQPKDRSEILPQWEQITGSGNNPSSNEAASPGNVDQCARYCLPPLDKGGFRVSDLVWGKVKSHPWWPGEIFDPSDASELALKHQKKNSHLVAYFGDNTFAWCDESQLKPLVTNYSQMEKQSSSDAFVSSVNNALEELSRRILSGMSCSCLPEELSDSGMSYTVENAGLKDGVTCSAVNRSEILKCFSPANLLHYIKELALFPGQGGDLLELVIACSQLTSFYRSKGCPELASFQTGSAWVEDGMDTLSAQTEMVEEAVINEVHPTHDKPKRGRGRPRKQKPEDDQEVKEKKGTSNWSNDTTYDDTVEKQMGMNFDDFDNLQNKKKRSLDSFEDSEKPSAPTGGSSFKIGECIRRAASQLTGSSSIVKAQNEPTVYKNAAEAENGEFEISSDDAVDELTVEKRAKRRRIYRNHTADPKELLSQLCLVATEPMNGYSFSATIISYFSDYRNYVVSSTTEASIVEKGTGRRGRKRKVLPFPEVETTDHMQDSYWSGLSLHNHPIHDIRKASSTTRLRRRRRSSQQTYVPSSELGASGPKKQIQVIERSIIHVDEKMVDELKPTALILSFARSAALPSEMDLIKMFSRYGPLKETKTEVHKDTNTVKVVFKKRIDAEIAFSVAGKYGTFGPSLRSYRLVNMPFSLSTSEANSNNPGTQPEECCLEVPGPSESEAPLDAMQVDQVDKTEKAEVVGEPSVERVETDQQTCLVEAADKTLANHIGMVDKTGQINAELTDHVDQFETAAQAEPVAEGSSEQVSTVVQACTRKEAAVESLSEITQSVAATGVSNGGTIDKIQQDEAPNQALIDDTTNTLQIEAASEAQTEDTVKQALHADATNEGSAQVVSDNMQGNVVAEAPKQGHISGDNAVFDAVAEVPTTEQVDDEADTVNEVPEELQSQTTNEKPVEQDATKEKMGSEAPKQVSGEVPCSTKLEAETLTGEPVGQVAVEQVKVQVESKTAVEASGEQAYSFEQTVQVDAVTEASGGQIEVEIQNPEDESMASAITEHSVMVEETVESKVEVPVEENVENNAAAAGLVEDTAEGETMAEAPYEKIENKAPAEALPGETKEGEITVEAPDVKAENEAIAEPITGEKAHGESTAEASDKETRTAEETVEDVKALDEKTTTDKITVEDATVVTPVEKSTTADKTVEDAIVETPGGKTTEVEETVEDAMVETPDGKTTEVEKTVEDEVVETSDGKTTEVEKTVEDATVEAPDENSSAAEKTIEGTMVGAPSVQAGVGEQTG
ncbi:uncharacterized protein LOC133929043 [Phragmites australis]|uniref:uncharacterized protein LOC133929043 n=1 Tax=Phragmites australis TaxID=29695 RepID=UPI002D79B367|nr:uncharacterized protein LOC133929043 [Phragmites australis]XP_062231611.1 uncharacterized protein LOC133929043 [Phragmites australis]